MKDSPVVQIFRETMPSAYNHISDAALCFWSESSARNSDCLPERILRLMVRHALIGQPKFLWMKNRISKASAPFPKLEEWVSTQQLSLSPDRNPKLYSSSASALLSLNCSQGTELTWVQAALGCWVPARGLPVQQDCVQAGITKPVRENSQYFQFPCLTITG